ncbi:MAG: (2Fe-2S)-binding protein [Pseudomonadota bacterium]
MKRLGANGRHSVSMVVNGTRRRGEAEPRMLLSDFLRHELGLSGTHVGCEHGVCGACTVQVDGEPARACLMLAVQAEGATIQTVEGLGAEDGTLGILQQAFRRHHALQCGFCTAGILSSLHAFFREDPDRSEREIRELLSGHICRCTGYNSIVAAAMDAGSVLRERDSNS